MTVLQIMWGKPVAVGIRVRRALVLGTVFASLLLLALPRALALDPERRISQYGHTVWRIQDGAISPPTNIAQTTDGFLWITTAQGLMRFDGIRFMPWQLPQGQNLPGTHFSAIFGSRDGSLWIGTTRGLARWKNGQLRTYTDLEHPAAIFAIIEDDSGTIWATRYGQYAREAPLCSISQETLRCFGKKDGIPVGYGLGLTHDSEGNIWFGSKVLVRWRLGTPATTYFGEIAELAKGDGVINVALGPSGTAWASLDGTGPQLGVRYYSEGKWTSYAVPGFDRARVRPGYLLVDRRGSLWVGTMNDGVYRICGGVADHYGVSDGLSGNSVASLFEDREGNIWVLTDGGLDKFRDTALISYTTRQGVSDSQFYSVMALRNGAVWMGTGGALNILRKQDRKTAVFDRKVARQGVGPMLEDHGGVVWLGVDLALLRFQNGHFREILAPGGKRFASFGGVTGIAEDSGGTIWVLATSGQLFSIVGDKIEKQASPNDELGRQKYLLADPNGGLWLGAPKGSVSHFRDGRLQTTSLSSPQGPVDINAPFVDSDNSLLIATSQGLYRLNHGQVTLFSSENGLPCPETFNVIRDNHGALWVYTRCGMVRIAEAEWAKWLESPHVAVSVMILDALDGAQAGTGGSFQPNSSKAPNGRLWFETGVSVQMLDPDRLYENALPPPVHIENVIADRKTYSPQGGLRLPALTRDLEIDYTALSFVVPQKVHFQYKLEGYDRDWQDAGTRRQAFYTNLPPRNYTFRVKACNNSGVWNEAGASVDFFVAPAFYQTVWFRSLAVLFFLAVLTGLYRLRLRHLERQRDALRRSEQELRDVIDTIPAIVWSALPDGSNTYVNKRWVEYTGSSAEQTSGSGWQALIHPDDLERHAGKWMEAVATGKPHESEVRFRRSDGQYRWHLDRGVPLRDEDGNIVRWYGVVTDIEDRKRAEEALGVLSRDLQDRLRLVIDTIPVQVTRARPDGSLDFINHRWLEFLGVSLEMVQDWGWTTVTHPEDVDRFLCSWRSAMASGEPFEDETRVRRADGQYRWLLVRAVPLRDDSGNIVNWYAAAVDIDDRKRAVQRLRESEAYLAEAQRLSQTGSWAWNPVTGDIRYWSEMCYCVLGFDPAGPLPRFEEFFHRIHPDDQAATREQFEKAIRDKADFELDYRVVHPEKGIRDIHVVGDAVLDLSGNLGEFVGTVIDVTERKRAEETLQQSQSYLTEGQRLAHMGSWAFDTNGFNYWSSELFRIYGLDPGGKPPTVEEYLALVHPEDRAFMKQGITQMMVDHLAFDFTKRIVRPDGEIRRVRCVGVPVTQGETFQGFLGTGMDVTEQDRLTEELRLTESHLAEAQKLTHTASWAWRLPDRKAVHNSEEFYRIYGFDPAKGAPTWEEYFERIHPEDRLKWTETIERAIVEKVDYDHEFRILVPNGMVKWIQTVGHPIFSAAGDLEHFAGSSTDITERKSAEQERERLRQLEADLAHTNRVSTLGEMAASLAHEIKQPIAAAITSANSCIEWLAHEPPNLDRARAAATRIDKYGNRAAEIIDRIRSFYRNSPPHRELVDVNGIVQEILTLLDGEATRCSIVMRTELTTELPKIMADRVQLQQVFMNLMLNAIEAMKDSGGKLAVKSALQDGQLQFSVSDTGVGLPMEKMDQIFSAFFTTKPQGSGMGLAISRSIVESHGGRLWAAANDGRGATFYFTLPTHVTESALAV